MGEGAVELSYEDFVSYNDVDDNRDHSSSSSLSESKASSFTNKLEHTLMVSIGKDKYKIYANIPEPVIVLKKIISRLDELASLLPNWDSYGARPIRTELIKDALSACAVGLRSCGIPEIFATSDGGLEMLYKRGAREFEFTLREPDGFEAYYIDEASGEEWDPGTLLTLSEIAPYFEKVMSSK